MPAYIVVDGEVTDPVRYEAYKKLAQTAIAKHGGRYLVRGGETSVLEERGSRIASSCSNFRVPARSGGSIRRPNTRQRVQRAPAPRG